MAEPSLYSEFRSLHSEQPCGARYGQDAGIDDLMLQTSHGWRAIVCTLPVGHDGPHEDTISDAPATMAWARIPESEARALAGDR